MLTQLFHIWMTKPTNNAMVLYRPLWPSVAHFLRKKVCQHSLGIRSFGGEHRVRRWLNSFFFFCLQPFGSVIGLYVEGIFRLSGSAKRIGMLQTFFDTPPHYGSQLDWRGYTVHDAANVMRRFLNYLPDPVIPHQFYHTFRELIGKATHACWSTKAS